MATIRAHRLATFSVDPGPRVVFPAENRAIGTSAEARRLILAFATSDGFQASVALFADERLRMAAAALGGEAVSEEDASPPALSH